MHMNTRWLAGFLVLGFCLLPVHLRAGGSGLNVVVVVNQNSSNSVQLGNYYCEQRQVPPRNYLRISWPVGNTDWAVSGFTNALLNPLLAMLTANQLTNQIYYVVLSMDIPYRVTSSDSVAINSTTSALFYGFKTDPSPPCSIAPGSTNLYAGSERIFQSTPPISANSNSFLAMMITSTNLALAEYVVDQGVASDGTFPTQTVYLAKSTDVARNVRFVLFDDAIFDTRLRGNYSMTRTNAYGIGDFGPLLGCQTAAYNFTIVDDDFAPGSMADNLDSFGGQIFQGCTINELANGCELNILGFLAAGAAGTYGTVDEPCNYLEKFPTPMDYFWQARGFGLAECFYQSVTNPYQGLLLGEPLAAPFAQPASGFWNFLGTNALLSGTTNLSLQFTASDAEHPLQQVDLFVDGTFVQTLTNIAPAQNNKLYVTINGYTTNYAIPAGASILSVASNLTLTLNGNSYSNATKVCAFAHGDRIELHSMNIAKLGSQVPISVSNSIGAGSVLNTFIAASRTNFLDTIAFGINSYQIAANPADGDVLRVTVTETNDTQVSLAVTNTTGQNLAELTQSLLDLISTNLAPSLQTSNGVDGSDLQSGTDGDLQLVQFNLSANTAGWSNALIEATFSGPAGYLTSGTETLDANLSDLEPRNHLYITAGVTNLPLTFAFNTTTQANGFHQLAAVVYEGSHVRTEKIVTQNVQIQNGPLSATLTTLVGASNTLVGATLQFSVAANTNNVVLIQLFSTGGLLASATNLASAVFSVPGTNLDVGLHPVYAVVTLASGQQYRTQTQWINLIAPFPVSITAPPPVLSWTAIPGHTYNILSTTNLALPFQFGAAVTPSVTAAQWTDASGPASKRFYRVQKAD